METELILGIDGELSLTDGPVARWGIGSSRSQKTVRELIQARMQNIGSFRAKKLDLPDGRNLDGKSVRSTSGLRMEDALNQEQELSEGGFEQHTQKS